jgi:DNA helicase HerA-like ATPase
MIGLTQEERARHMYVIGATGTGKTTMLLSMINQDLKNGNGVCVVDPHGDLAEAAINCIPDDRIKDLIYFNPFDIKYPIGVNLLELTPGLDGDDSLLEKEFITESVISLFRKLFSDAWAAHPHRIEYILRNTIHTAFTLENPTLFTIFDLLNDPVFQKKVVSQVQDENLKNFWKFEFGKAGDYQKVKMVAPVTARIGRFLFSPSAKRILEQEKSTINFDEILDGKKILICNLAKGNLGEDTSEMMGITILNKIQLAALKRARVERAKRNEFYLFVDEFQNFATPSFIQMLSEARKYGLSLTMAEQTTSQQKDRNLVDIILANAGTVVTFRSANPKDEQLLLPQFYPYINAGEISNLPSYHFYMKKAAIIPDEPFSGETMPVTIIKDRNKWKRFIEASRNDNAIVYVTKQKSIKIANNGQEQRAEDRQDSQPKTGLPA